MRIYDNEAVWPGYGYGVIVMETRKNTKVAMTLTVVDH